MVSLALKANLTFLAALEPKHLPGSPTEKKVSQEFGPNHFDFRAWHYVAKAQRPGPGHEAQVHWKSRLKQMEGECL